jgi:nucleoside-diphosphate-sugar epimerase
MFTLPFAQLNYHSFEADDGEMVDEYSKVADTPRAQRLIQAEEACLQPGGAVLRLAGLYTLERGAHNFWLTSGKDVAGRADGIINLLHYDDAAGACMAAIHVCAPQGIYLISDGNPLTRKEICESAFKSKMYQGLELPKFLGTETDPRGKIYNGSRTNQALKWKPRYSSFDEFMSQQSQ